MSSDDRATLEAVDLTKRFADGTLALDAFNLRVEGGEIYCLLGAPGAGKSTALDLFLGFTRPTAGRALVCGIDAAQDARGAKSKIGYVMEDPALYGNLTAVQNLAFFASLGGRGDAGRDALTTAMREVGLPERCFDRRVATFSRGMRQKLTLAMAMLKEAPVLLLDEPIAGLDPKAAAELAEILESLRDRGRAILLATHNLFHARQLADRVGILKEGRTVLTATREELRYQSLETLYLDHMRGLGGRYGAERSMSSSVKPY